MLISLSVIAFLGDSMSNYFLSSPLVTQPCTLLVDLMNFVHQELLFLK